jgi:hypothetical protein
VDAFSGHGQFQISKYPVFSLINREKVQRHAEIQAAEKPACFSPEFPNSLHVAILGTAKSPLLAGL